MGQPASNAKANTGVTLGSIGLGLGVLNAMNNNCGCGGGLLGGLFGGNCNCNRGIGLGEVQYVSQLQAENAMLKSENYADKVGKETYMQSLADNRSLRDEMYAYIKPLAEEAANNRVNIATLAAEQKCCCEKQELRDQITAGKINEMGLAINGKIDTMVATNTGAFNSVNQTIQCISNSVNDLAHTLGQITATIIPLCKICPQPMQRFNSWAAPTTQAGDCQSNNVNIQTGVAAA